MWCLVIYLLCWLASFGCLYICFDFGWLFYIALVLHFAFSSVRLSRNLRCVWNACAWGWYKMGFWLFWLFWVVDLVCFLTVVLSFVCWLFSELWLAFVCLFLVVGFMLVDVCLLVWCCLIGACCFLSLLICC